MKPDCAVICTDHAGFDYDALREQRHARGRHAQRAQVAAGFDDFPAVMARVRTVNTRRPALTHPPGEGIIHVQFMNA